MIGSIIGGAMSVAGSIFGGITASRAMEKYKQGIEAQRRQNQNWYDRRYNEDATQRADAQRVLTKLNEDIKSRNRAAAGTAAVMGGTEESVAATKAANAEGMADAASRIAAAGEARKDRIEEQYMQRNQELDQQLANLELQKAQNTAKAVQGVASAAGSIASNWGSWGDKG